MFKIAISSIAWSDDEEIEIAELMYKENIRYVELAPTKIWPEKIKTNPESIADEEIERVIAFWGKYNIVPVAMQSMLYLRPDLTIFENSKKREETASYLERFIELSARMGIRVMVFGSPKNRQVNGLASEDANKIAKDFFYRIGEKAKMVNVDFCIEPNPTSYNCDFVVNAEQGAELVKIVESDGFNLHLDAAGMYLANDNPEKSIIATAGILKHFHISAPQLDIVDSTSPVDYELLASSLKKISYGGYVSIEMRPGAEGSNIGRINRTIDFIKTIGM